MIETTVKPKITKEMAIRQLWLNGILTWKLDECQKELYNLYYNTSHRVQTWLLARRFGKTFTLCIIGIEQCLRKPNSIVKFVAPTKLQLNTILRPIFKQILNDCPDEIKPDFKGKDYIYYFPNGSEIQLAGSNMDHIEKLRGGDADLVIVDEAGTCTNLDYAVKEVLLPTTLMTKGKILLASTPPKESDHNFYKYIEQADARGSLIKKNIYQNSRLTKEDIDELIEEQGGINSEATRRELFCEIIKDSATSVIPEFTEVIEKEIVKEWPTPPFCDGYVAMDLGAVDLTAVIFGYYDFRAGKVIIEDELILDFAQKDNNIEKLTRLISEKETSLWLNKLTNEKKEPFCRVSDINYIVTKEISYYSHNTINFLTAKKDDNDAAINTLRILINNKKIIINPRCKTLINHLRHVKWKSLNNKTTFARSPDGHHYDAVDALKYLVRHVSFNKNPYPITYDLNLKKEDAFIRDPANFRYSQSPTEVYKQIFGHPWTPKRRRF